MSTVREFKSGDIIRHFKRDLISQEEKDQNKGLYVVHSVATHTETNEPMLVYQALYHPFGIFTRPLKMALEKTDKNKYPEAKQEYRLELYSAKED